MNTEAIQLGTSEALTLVQTLVPILEASIPAVGAAAGPVGLGVSAATILLPIIIRLVADLADRGAIDAPTQAALLHRVANVLDFSAPQWKPSTAK